MADTMRGVEYYVTVPDAAGEGAADPLGAQGQRDLSLAATRASVPPSCRQPRPRGRRRGLETPASPR
jgi:hypothetical protein